MVVLSTIHGAKGGEADYVFLLSPETLKVSIFDQVWSDATDRDNTLYVAITRARLPLCFVGHMPTLARFSPLPGAEDEGVDLENDQEAA
jgi:superfamily I DNA/RNA helicase